MTKLADAFVELRSDSTKFAAEARVQVSEVLDSISAAVGIGADTSGLRGEVTRGIGEAVTGQKASVEVTPDMTGFKSYLEARIKADEEGLGVHVPVEIDSFGLDDELARIEVKVKGLAAVKANIPVGVDPRDIDARMAELVAKARAIADEARIRIVAEVDEGVTDEVLAAIPAKAAAIERASKIEIKVDVDKSNFDRLSETLDKTKGKGFELDQVLTAIKFGAIAGGATEAAAGLASLGAGAIGLVAALAPLVGVLGALPTALAGIGQGFAVFKLATGGIKEAVTAMGAEHAKAGVSAQTQADAEVAAAERVKSAKETYVSALERAQQVEEDGPRRLAAARDQLAVALQRQQDVATTGNRRVETTERSLAEALVIEQKAQEDLTHARQTAARQLDDLREKVENQGITEAQAVLRLDEARKQAAVGQRAPGQSRDPAQRLLDQRAATLAVKSAEEELERVRLQGLRDAEDLAAANAKGVEGSDAVVAAKTAENKAQQTIVDTERQLRELRVTNAREAVTAAHDVAKAQQTVADTQRDNARAQRDAAVAVVRAADGITAALRAQEKAGRDSGSAASAAKVAFDKLTPAAQRFATFLYGLKPQFEALKGAVAESFLPGVQAGIEKMLGLAPVITESLVESGHAFADFFTRLGAQVSTSSFKTDLRDILRDSTGFMTDLGTATLDVLHGLTDIAHEAQPLILGLGGLAKEWAQHFRDWAAEGRRSGNLRDFFRETYETVKLVTRVIGDLWTWFGRLLTAAKPLGDELLRMFAGSLEKSTALMDTVEGHSALKDFFRDALPPLKEFFGLVGDLGGALLGISHQEMPDLTHTLHLIRQDLLPAIIDLLQRAAPLGRAVVDLIDAIVKNQGFRDGLGAIIDSFTAIVDALTWIIDNVPGIGPILGGLAGAFLALKAYHTIFDPIAAGAQGLIHILGNLKATIAAVTAAEGFGKLGALGTLFTGPKAAAGAGAASSIVPAGLGAGGAGLATGETAATSSGLSALLGPVAGATAALAGLVLIGKQLGDTMAGNEGPIGAFRDAVGKLFGISPEVDHFKNSTAAATEVLRHLADNDVVPRLQSTVVEIKALADAFGIDLEAAAKKGKIALNDAQSFLGVLSADFASLRESTGLTIPALLQVANALGIDLKKAASAPGPELDRVIARISHAATGIAEFGKQSGLTAGEAQTLADALGINLSQAADVGGKAFDDAKAKILAGADELATHAGYANFSVAKNAGETLKTLKDLAAEADRFKSSAESAFKSQTSFISSFQSEGPTTADAIGKFFTDSIAKTKQWGEDIRALMATNLDRGFIKTLVEAGPQAADKVAGVLEFVKGGGDKIINEAQTGQQALIDNLIAEINHRGPDVKGAAAALPDQARQGTEEGVAGAAVAMGGAGAALAKFFKDGVVPATPPPTGQQLVAPIPGQASAAVGGAGHNMLGTGKALRDFFHGGVTTQNPSVGPAVVNPVVAGTAGSVNANSGNMQRHGWNLKSWFHSGFVSDPQAGRNAGSQAIEPIKQGIFDQYGNLRNAGHGGGISVDEGVAQGIRDGAYIAGNAAVDMAKRLLSDFKGPNGINQGSPSRLFRASALSIGEGIAMGIRDGEPEAVKALTDLARRLAGTKLKATVGLGFPEPPITGLGGRPATGTLDPEAALARQSKLGSYGLVHEDNSVHIGSITTDHPEDVPAEIARKARSRRWLVGSTKAPSGRT